MPSPIHLGVQRARGLRGVPSVHAKTREAALRKALAAVAHALQHTDGNAAGMWLYLAGPITGMPDGNRSAFTAAADTLRHAGFGIVNPRELPHMPLTSWTLAMRLDLPMLMLCDGIALLPGWAESDGARMEHTIATRLGLPAHPVGAWETLAQQARCRKVAA